MAEGTFLVVNIPHFPRLVYEAGNEAAASLDARFGKLVRDAIEAHGGMLVTRRAGEAACLFPSVTSAVRAAGTLHDRLEAELDDGATAPIRAGIGLAAGTYVDVDGVYVSQALELSDRLSALAEPGEIAVGEHIAQIAGQLPGITAVEDGLIQMRDIPEALQVFQIVPSPAGSSGC